MSNKNLCMFLISRNGNNILIWSWNNSQQDQTSELNLPGNLQEMPPDLQFNQPFSSQMWNFDDILFDLNRI